MDEKYFVESLKAAGISEEDIIKIDKAKRRKFYEKYRKIKLAAQKKAEELNREEEQHDFKQDYIDKMREEYPNLAELQSVKHIKDIEDLADEYNLKLNQMRENAFDENSEEYKLLKEKADIFDKIAREGRKQADSLDNSLLSQPMEKAIIQRTLKELEESRKAENKQEELGKNQKTPFVKTLPNKEKTKKDIEISPLKK